MKFFTKLIAGVAMFSLSLGFGRIAAGWSGNLSVSTPSWGRWSGPTHGELKTDHRGGIIEFVRKSSIFNTFGDLYSTRYQRRASNHAHKIPFDVTGRFQSNRIHFSYNGDWYNELISARVSSSYFEPSWTTTVIRFIP